MVEWVSNRIATSIKKANPEHTSSIEVMAFSLILIVNTFAIIFCSLIVGWVTGKLPETAITLFAFAVLKFVSGGYHLKSSDMCILYSTLGMTILPHIPIYENWIIWMTAISFVLAAIYAPANMNKKARIPERYYPVLKVISLIIIGSNFIFNSDILAKVFLLQAVMLFPIRRG